MRERSATTGSLHRLGSALAALAVAVASPGCTFTQFFARTVESWGHATQPAPHRITEPYRPDARLAVSWIGHATALVQLDDKLVLTDPVFTRTVGQLAPRLVEPGIRPEELPAVDAVLISHLHFDHLSLGSLELIERKVKWLGMPEGGLAYLTDFAFAANEVRCWATHESGGMRFTAVPVQHGGWRYGLDRPWMPNGATGWVIEYHGLTVYYGGDTAYNQENFLAAQRRFPHIDVALLPIAPIEPREHMKSRHLDPKEALDAYADLGARWLVPIHYDTFVNSLDDDGAPLRALEGEMKRRGLGPSEVVVMGIGEQRVLRGRAQPTEERAGN